MKREGGGVYRRTAEIDFDLRDLPRNPLPDAVLFVRPTYFQVDYVINPHMEPHVGAVDTQRATNQWVEVVEAYRALGLEVAVIDGRPGLPDMVFSANQTLPFITSQGSRAVVLSTMASPERTPEVQFLEQFFENRGYESFPAPDDPFEGMGDALWHPGRRLLWLGTGYRSSSSAVEFVSRTVGAPTVELKLVDSHFYHLDTCLSLLSEDTALWVPSAFDNEAQRMVQKLIPFLIAVPETEAKSLLACNAHCPDGHHVVIQTGCNETSRLIRDRGFAVVECETGEYLKSGGSVFCMKQMFWTRETAQ